MVRVIEFRIDAKRATAMVNGITTRFPKEMGEAGNEFLKLCQRNVRLQHTRTSTRRTGRIWSGIRAHQRPNFRGWLAVSKQGLYLDSMKQHYVSLKRGRVITKWARKYFTGKRVKAQVPAMAKSRVYKGPRGAIKGALHVTPHPFIDDGLARSYGKLQSILQRGLNKTMGGR